jgi:hypothetical protein
MQAKNRGNISINKDEVDKMTIKAYIKHCRKTGGLLAYMRNECKIGNSCYVY